MHRWGPHPWKGRRPRRSFHRQTGRGSTRPMVLIPVHILSILLSYLLLHTCPGLVARSANAIAHWSLVRPEPAPVHDRLKPLLNAPDFLFAGKFGLSGPVCACVFLLLWVASVAWKHPGCRRENSPRTPIGSRWCGQFSSRTCWTCTYYFMLTRDR